MADTHQLNEDPEALLQKTAAAARKLIPGVVSRIQELTTEVDALKVRLSRLQQLSALADGAAEVVTSAPSVGDEDGNPLEHIKAVLLSVPEGMKAPEIKDEIFRRFGRKWGESTIYAYLSKGKSTVFSNENTRWTLTDSAKAELF